ncbi:nitroreductase [Nonomuraea rubra]|uniref:nitroreductase n=1 Tax=Nonomuraea rubra TaxID=46180 RepID=UPI0033FA8C0D
MNVYEAVTSRRAVRGFTDQPVPMEVLKRVLSAAAWAPSGSNLQPWHIYVVTGEPLAEIKRRAGARLAAGDPWDEREYEMYPADLKSPYRERRSAFGRERYGALGVARDDWESRQRAAAGNWQCFGAPVALFCYIDRDLGLPQWADVGMYLQTVMLLLREEGLHSCPQMSWSVYRETVADVLHPPEELMLFCGLSIGFEDVRADYNRTGRAPLDETVTFVTGTANGHEAPVVSAHRSGCPHPVAVKLRTGRGLRRNRSRSYRPFAGGAGRRVHAGGPHWTVVWPGGRLRLSCTWRDAPATGSQRQDAPQAGSPRRDAPQAGSPRRGTSAAGSSRFAGRLPVSSRR